MLANYHVHTLENTLKQIERLSIQYYTDLLVFKDLSLEEFFYVVSKRIYYEPDPPGLERVCRPLITLKLRSGDCDDKTVMCLSFFILKNMSCGYSIVRQANKNSFHHIFPFFLKHGAIVDYDATYENSVPFVSQNWAERKNYVMEYI